ncbi:MAG: cytochrome c [Gemmatimonadota bacterium]
MTRSNTLLAALSVLALSACASSGTADSMPSPAGDGEMETATAAAAPAVDAAPMAASSSFTEAQADRGRDVFRASCTECHYSSEFSDSQFKFKWSRRSAGNLYELIQTSMPETAPGSLLPEEAVDLVTYIMRMNGFEPGDAELGTDRAALDEISFASIRD